MYKTLLIGLQIILKGNNFKRKDCVVIIQSINKENNSIPLKKYIENYFPFFNTFGEWDYSSINGVDWYNLKLHVSHLATDLRVFNPYFLELIKFIKQYIHFFTIFFFDTKSKIHINSKLSWQHIKN